MHTQHKLNVIKQNIKDSIQANKIYSTFSKCSNKTKTKQTKKQPTPAASSDMSGERRVLTFYSAVAADATGAGAVDEGGLCLV